MSPSLIQEVEDDSLPPRTLELTSIESTLRRLLLDVAEYVEKKQSASDETNEARLPEDLANQPIVLRFTGGWVRDKLLGVLSHDIDVAINKMTGYQFGLRMKEYLEIRGNAEKYGLDGVATTEGQSQKAGATDKSKIVGGLHKIEANPEKSKHLETVTTRILGLDIDIVNLRKETYTDDSRNPQMEFGTAEEDALRRDATVNAMFYNLNTQQIEDLSGKGHDDMARGLLRTPLDPYQTFKDDPLRVLRLIRFASRLGYTIDPKTLVAMHNSEIKEALRRKISRERVGTEIEKALRGPDPHEALRLVFDLGLYKTIFSDPTQSHEYDPDTTGWRTVLDCLEDMMRDARPLAELLVQNEEDRFMAWQLAALVPYRDAPLPEPPAPGRKPPPPIATQVAREGVKATNKVSEIITAALQNQEEISSLADKVYERKWRPDKLFQGEDVLARDVLGMAIRRWGPSWRSQVVYSFCVDIVETAEHGEGSTELTERKYTTFVQHLQQLDILDAHALKPLLDGKTLAKALKTPPGPWMKDALDVVMAWQLRNPDIHDPQAALEAVRSGQEAATASDGELTSALVHHFLKLTIRPLFTKASPNSVTDTGRKVTTNQLPPKMTTESMDDSVNKPWKSSKDGHELALLAWVVNVLDERMIQEVWHLLVPPVLTLVDDWETKYKVLGAQMLRTLLELTLPQLLERTGLGEVFEEALMPFLTYTPPVSTEDESVELLSATYPALVTLATVRYHKSLHTTIKHPASKLQRQRVRCLDTVVRKGIIYGLAHSTQYPRLMATLCSQLATLLDELGIESVKHLQYILPLLTHILSRPAAAATVPMLLSAATATQSVIRNGWPRMLEYRGEVLKGLTMCWLNVASQEGAEVHELRKALITARTMLQAAVARDCDFCSECKQLVAADPRLGGLVALP